MVEFVKREKNDIFNKPILRFLFKNQKFLFALRVAVTALFFYAIYYGFTHPGRENIFTSAVFWGVFWALFMVVTLPTFGRIFCGICPHGFMGKYITKWGLKKQMPQWMQNRYIGIFILVIGWWAIYYTFDGFWKSPLNTAMMFGVLTLFSFVIYYIYKDMSYCKYICPIGTLTRAYDKLSFTKLETYTEHCKECKTFECAGACPYALKPFTFAKKNQTEDCTLCMECAHSCEAVKFKFTKPAEQLNKKLKILNAEIWTYILILASIPVSMGFAHGLNRAKIADEFIWNQSASFFGMSEYAGGFAFMYAVIFTVFSAFIGLYLASKTLQKDFNTIFTTLGVALIPLFIFASLGHTLESFFTRGYEKIVEGFAQGFGIIYDAQPLAKRGDGWLHYFGLFKWVGIIWSFIILYKRMKLIEATKLRKTIAYLFASFAILFYIGLNIYTGYVFKTYGAKSSGHSGHNHSTQMKHSHGNGEMFQSVSFKQATLLQEGKDKASCPSCGMKLPMFYKTNHSAILEGKIKQYCSIHCLVEDLKIKKLPLANIQVVDVTSLKFIDAKTATYVVGSSKPGTMSSVSKYAFASKKDAYKFKKQYGGAVVDFDTAVQKAMEDFSKKNHSKKKHHHKSSPSTPIYFSFSDPSKKKGSHGGGHGMHGMGKPKDPNVIPTKTLYLASGKFDHQKLYRPKMIKTYYIDANLQKKELQEKSKRGKPSYSFEIPKDGYYNIFAIDETKVKDKNYYKVAKLEYLYGKHGSDTPYSNDVKNQVKQNFSKIDLIRIKSDEEKSFFHRHYMGDRLEFVALFENKPLADARVKINMQSGWTRVLKTDKDGKIQFDLIRDYFPKGEKFNKRFKQEFLITLKYAQDDTDYILTYPAYFYPNESDYKSYGYGLIMIFITLILSGIIVYRFRKNRAKPYQEVRIDE